MASQRLGHLVCLILLQTWTWESLGKDSQTAVYELPGQENVLEFIQQTVKKLRPVSGLGPGAQVVFDVEHSGNGAIVTAVTTIIYDKINVNKGEGYSGKTGKFTAPRCGLYFFSYSSLPGRGMKTDVQLLKNGKEVSLIHSVLPKDSSQLSMRNIILELHKGDEVWVQLIAGNLWSKIGSLSFQGFLLGQ
ncbi:complement C1q tumor necrosis factor-related protein 3-like isoform X3 [Pristis pectinata]|uniref:complement C1q tumor necrosis factor-related protein 3-like isoform X3 n=1 Tax=Pristis pectinata TaxID=685728 RepID=UPI00223D819A|nr:complement C1q tumor necrosis factor-related protein 3-like isoform X3 [Pristis pectinata]